MRKLICNTVFATSIVRSFLETIDSLIRSSVAATENLIRSYRLRFSPLLLPIFQFGLNWFKFSHVFSLISRGARNFCAAGSDSQALQQYQPPPFPRFQQPPLSFVRWRPFRSHQLSPKHLIPSICSPLVEWKVLKFTCKAREFTLSRQALALTKANVAGPSAEQVMQETSGHRWLWQKAQSGVADEAQFSQDVHFWTRSCLTKAEILQWKWVQAPWRETSIVAQVEAIYHPEPPTHNWMPAQMCLVKPRSPSGYHPFLFSLSRPRSTIPAAARLAIQAN